ncbi:hypothetical protein DFH07DRAFT_768892 [Mycena maculata]|uniref:Uncharacterized protein n=1 Tax=Mycena maculata TaxID=230809 RepID=A0AAD7JQA7_9AGAR|nr:hypothetical protein DFH07DRAFT_768892 [Mycena maculata]
MHRPLPFSFLFECLLLRLSFLQRPQPAASSSPRRPQPRHDCLSIPPSMLVAGPVCLFVIALLASGDNRCQNRHEAMRAEFRGLLHEAIRDGLNEGIDDVQINGAAQLGNGWTHIRDERNIPALGRIGDPDDIIASVLVEDGQIRPETYESAVAHCYAPF